MGTTSNIKAKANRRKCANNQFHDTVASITVCGSEIALRGGVYQTSHDTYPIICMFSPLAGVGYPNGGVSFKGTCWLVFKKDSTSNNGLKLAKLFMTGQDDNGLYYQQTAGVNLETDKYGVSLGNSRLRLADNVEITLENIDPNANGKRKV